MKNKFEYEDDIWDISDRVVEVLTDEKEWNNFLIITSNLFPAPLSITVPLIKHIHGEILDVGKIFTINRIAEIIKIANLKHKTEYELIESGEENIKKLWKNRKQITRNLLIQLKEEVKNNFENVKKKSEETTRKTNEFKLLLEISKMPHNRNFPDP